MATATPPPPPSAAAGFTSWGLEGHIYIYIHVYSLGLIGNKGQDYTGIIFPHSQPLSLGFRV